jgi:hypothetical protein
VNIGQQMQALYKRFGDIDEVTIELHKALLAINVRNRAAEATVFFGSRLGDFRKCLSFVVLGD